MDADVKGAMRTCVVGHGGAVAGRLATGVRLSTTVTLRCAGRDRRTVSGRELPRTRVASRDRIEASRVLRASAPVARPPVWSWWSGGEDLLSWGLVGHLG